MINISFKKYIKAIICEIDVTVHYWFEHILLYKMVWAQVLTTYYVLIIYRYDEEKQSSTCIQIVKLTIIPERGHSRSGCNFVKWCWKKREENEYLLCEIDVEAINSTWKIFLYIHFILLHSLEVCVCVCVRITFPGTYISMTCSHGERPQWNYYSVYELSRWCAHCGIFF